MNLLLQTVSGEFEFILNRVSEDEQTLKDIHCCWSAYNRSIQLSLPWLVEAEKRLKDAEIIHCKVCCVG